MKKFLIIGGIVALVLILVGGAGMVYAKVRNLDNNAVISLNTDRNGDRQIPFGYGPGGMMNGYGYRTGGGGIMGGYGPGGMMGGYGPEGMMGGRGLSEKRGYGLMHDYMISAFAKAVGLTVEDVNTRLANGETLAQIASAQGFTGDKLTQLVTDVRKAALDQAVAEGVITQAQADVMLQHMENYMGEGFGPGSGFGDCPMWDGDETQP
ncbi:MAG TPA: hypothetical protein VLD65_06590 [Anaerolineales bacterium]|nr:hypothetical protein [Anaerolineales bacterium]